MKQLSLFLCALSFAIISLSLLKKQKDSIAMLVLADTFLSIVIAFAMIFTIIVGRQQYLNLILILVVMSWLSIFSYTVYLFKGKIK